MPLILAGTKGYDATAACPLFRTLSCTYELNSRANLMDIGSNFFLASGLTKYGLKLGYKGLTKEAGEKLGKSGKDDLAKSLGLQVGSVVVDYSHEKAAELAIDVATGPVRKTMDEAGEIMYGVGKAATKNTESEGVDMTFSDIIAP